MIALATGAAVMVIALLAILLLIRSASRSVRFDGIGPTPEEQRAKQEAADIDRRIKEQADKDAQEVTNARREGRLVDLARRKLFRTK